LVDKPGYCDKHKQKQTNPIDASDGMMRTLYLSHAALEELSLAKETSRPFLRALPANGHDYAGNTRAP